MASATDPAPSGPASRAARLPPGRAGVASALGVALLLQACTGEQVTEVDVSSVTVVPSAVNLVAGEEIQLEATVRDDAGQPLLGAAPTWSTEDASIASVDASGLVRGFGAGVVAVRATYRDVSGGATVRVIPGPGIASSRDSVAMFAAASASDPRPETVHITNDGTGALEGLEVSVRHPDGSPAWLSVELAATTAPTSLTLSAATEGLGAGVHRATAVVTAPSAGGAGLEIPVTLGLIAIAVEETGGTTRVAEDGTSDSLLVRLEARPPGDLVLGVESSDAGEAVVEPDRLTFDSETWSVARTVTIAGVDDSASDGDRTTAIRFVVDPAASADEVDDLPPLTVDVTTVDDDLPGLIEAETGGSTVVSESGSTDVATVRLAAAPSSDVVVRVRSADTGEMTVAPTIVRFTPDNWSVARAVTVRGVDDGSADGDQETVLTFSVDPAESDDAYDGVSDATITVTTTDDDRTGLSVAESGGATSVSEGGTTDAVTVALTAQPATNVVVTVVTADAGEVTVSPGSLTFTPADWSGPKTVTVTGVDDPLPDGDVETTMTVAVDPARSDDAFDDLPSRSITVTTVDDDGAEIAVVQSGGGTVVTEDGDSDEVTVALTAQPANDVVVTVTSGDVAEVTAAPARLTFTSADWSAPRTVTLTGVDDFIDDGSQTTTVTFSIDAAASDDAFDAATDQTVAVTTTDNDAAAGLTVTEIGGTRVAESGTTDDLAVSLTAQPATDVVLAVASADPGEVTVSPSTLTFTSANWSTAQTVTVQGVDDDATDGDQVTVVSVSVDAGSSDAAYGGVAPVGVSVTTTDDDLAGLVVTEPAGGTVVGEDGATAQVLVALASQPTSSVVVSVTSSDATEALAAPLTLTFTAATWSTAQTVTITGVDDFVDDGDQTTSITFAVVDALSDDAFDPLSDEVVTATTTDNDAPAGLIVTETVATQVTEAGATDAFTVALTSQPATSVVLSVVSADAGEVSASPATLTFTSASWSTAQSVTVTGVDDALADGDQTIDVTVSVDPSASDPTYAGVAPVSVSVTVVDDDVAALSIAESGGATTVTEAGGTDTFTVVLTAQPLLDVVLTVVGSAPAEATASPTSLTFGPTTWGTPQTVTVTGVDDAVVDGDQISTITIAVDAAASDDAYDAVAAESVAVTTLDDETSVRPATEG